MIAPGSAPEFSMSAGARPLRVKAPEGCPRNAVDAAQGNAVDAPGAQQLEQRFWSGLESSQSQPRASALSVVRDRYGCLSGPTPLTRRWTLNSTTPLKHRPRINSSLREKRAARTGSSSRRMGFPLQLSYT